jgi:hypothetical protein
VSPGAAAECCARPALPRSAKAGPQPAPAALSRLSASDGFQGVLRQAAQHVARLGGGAAGRACLAEWGYAGSDVDELREVLLESAARYSRHADA